MVANIGKHITSPLTAPRLSGRRFLQLTNRVVNLIKAQEKT
jgi:hypothetical protein